MTNNAFTLTVDTNGIGRLVFDLPGEKINKFSPEVLDAFEKVIDEIANDKRIKVLAISSGKEGVFIAGVDLHHFEPIFKEPEKGIAVIQQGHRIFNKLSNLPFPTVALIRGACLGGGMEMALACTYRVASDHPKTQLGLPEVTLGIMPGWGGTQRMPRLVGLIAGLPLVLGGKALKPMKAWKIHLVDALYAEPFFDKNVEAFLSQCITPHGRKKIEMRRKRHGFLKWLLEGNPLGRCYLYHRAKKDILKRTKGHYPAPLVALDLIKKTFRMSLQHGLENEIKTFTNNLTTAFAIAPNLINLFFINEALKKDAGYTSDVKPAVIRSVGVIGAGTMGSGIAWLFSSRDFSVRLKDINWDMLGKGIGAAYALYAKKTKEKKFTSAEASLKFHEISATTDYSGFQHTGLVLEAAVEDLELKRKIFHELEKVVKSDTIIASNTSSLLLDDMSQGMEHPERFLAMHFFNPVDKMPLVEVVATPKTAPEAIVAAVHLCRKVGKTPIIVGDCHGFLVNRIFVSEANEIMRMFEEGVHMKILEKMVLDFGMPMSPFLLADEVGNDVGYKVSKQFEAAYGKRMAVPEFLTTMYEKKLFGRKCGKGFYLYHGNKRMPNSEVERLVHNKHAHIPESDMQGRAILIMVNEAARCLQENIINDPRYLDMALIMGIGFPPFRGGLLRYADTLGIDHVVDDLKRFHQQYGERFEPAPLLLDMQRSGKTFFT